MTKVFIWLKYMKTISTELIFSNIKHIIESGNKKNQKLRWVYMSIHEYWVYMGVLFPGDRKCVKDKNEV